MKRIFKHSNAAAFYSIIKKYRLILELCTCPPKEKQSRLLVSFLLIFFDFKNVKHGSYLIKLVSVVYVHLVGFTEAKR